MKHSLVTIRVRPGITEAEKSENFNKALKKFKRRTNDSGHLLELRDRQEFKKKSAKKREQSLLAKRNQARFTLYEKYINQEIEELPVQKRKKNDKS